ncbi:MAG: hypothetical protein H6853_05955 [Rhodospirillales bacterium]|nr:hypothetical protein [Alphaproteobacteria bacterium]USO03085.1 MAG: hypothetical protein H6853_05955 [Rhodospirillales bacterium]
MMLTRDNTAEKLFRLLFCTAVLLCSALVATKAYAEDDDLTGCASDTWIAMYNQATLQARRETVMNQTFITKPDSVLQYSCFEKALQYTEKYAGPVFSETDHWRGLPVIIDGKSVFNPKKKTVYTKTALGSTSLDMAITSAVRSAMKPYLNANFNHTMLGGTTEIPGKVDDCKLMNTVWKAAQCNNFEDSKVFYKFEELIGYDPRQYPPDIPCNYTGIEQEHIDIAQNKGFAHAKFSKVKTHLKYLLNEGGGNCPRTIATGVFVYRVRAAGQIGRIHDYKDAVCSNVGCVYKSKGKNYSDEETKKQCQ